MTIYEILAPDTNVPTSDHSSTQQCTITMTDWYRSHLQPTGKETLETKYQ